MLVEPAEPTILSGDQMHLQKQQIQDIIIVLMVFFVRKSMKEASPSMAQAGSTQLRVMAYHIIFTIGWAVAWFF